MKMKHAVGLAIAALAMAAAQGPVETVPAAAVAPLRAGDRLAASGQNAAALARYRDAIAAAPGCALCYLRAGELEQSSGDFDLAERDLEQSLSHASDAPMNAQAQAAIAELLDDRAGYGYPAPQQAERMQAAVSHYRAALEQAPGPAPAWHFRLALVLFRLDRDAEGIAEMQQVLAAPNLDPEVAAKARLTIQAPGLGRTPIAPAIPAKEGGDAIAGQVAVVVFWGDGPRSPQATALLAAIRMPGVVFVNIGADAKLRDEFGIHEYPSIVVIGKDGEVHLRMNEITADAARDLRAAIDNLLAAKL